MGKGNKVEFLVAMCALITSVIAVYVAWDQGRVMRAQQHGSVYPVLQIEGYFNTNNDNVVLGIRLINSGVGPALIESVRLYAGPEAEEITDMMAGFSDFPTSNDISWTGLAGRAIAPGESVVPVEVRWPRTEVNRNAAMTAAASAGEWRLEICYCSVFGRCWETREIGVARADRVASCTPEDSDVFSRFGEQVMASSSANPVQPAETQP